VQTHMLCVLTNHCEWRSCSHESEVANWRRNVIGSELRQWQPGEHIDNGRHARYSHAHCRRLLLESHRSQKRLECHVARKPVKVPAEELGWSLARQEVAYPDRPMTNIQFEMPSQGACRILHHIRWQHPTRWMSYVRCGRAFASLGDASFRRRTSKASIPLLIPVSSKQARVTKSHQPRSG
jgi:hypothetical protein